MQIIFEENAYDLTIEVVKEGNSYNKYVISTSPPGGAVKTDKECTLEDALNAIMISAEHPLGYTLCLF